MNVLVIIHRINTIEGLRKIEPKYGVEIDIRHNNKTGRLYLNHDPGDGDDFEKYLKVFSEQGNRFVIFNIKEAGIEQEVIDLAVKYGVENYFLLDVEFSFIFRATRKLNFRKVAFRYGEAEPIEAVEVQIKEGIPLVDWVWIGTDTLLPLDENIIKKLKPFKTCLVCPERWGRPEDIFNYIEKMKKLNFKLDAVMTSYKHAKQWEESGILNEFN